MKRIALAALFVLSTLAHADTITVRTEHLRDTGMMTFTVPAAGSYEINIAAVPGSPRVSRTMTLLWRLGEISFGAGYEMTFHTDDLLPGETYRVLIQNVTPRGVDSCADVCDAQAWINRL
jgi:hypothetical protein